MSSFIDNLYNQADAEYKRSLEPQQPQTQRNTSALGDAATAFKAGVLDIPGTITGALDVPVAALTGRPLVSEGWDNIGELTGFQPGKWADAARQNEYSQQHQDFRQELQQRRGDPNSGFLDTAGYALSNPLQSALVGVESLPGMLAGGVAARSLKFGSGLAGNIGRGIAGEGTIMAGQAMNQAIEEGVDPRRAAASAAVTGVLGGVIGGGMGTLTGKMGLVDPDMLLAGGTRAVGGVAQRGLAARMAGGAVAEGLFEEAPQSYLETVSGNWAAGRPLTEGAASDAGFGAVVGGMMGAAFNIPGARKPVDMTGDETPATDNGAIYGPEPTQPDNPAYRGAQELPAEPRAAADIRAEYASLAEQAKAVRGDPEQLKGVVERMTALRAEAKAAGVPSAALSRTQAEKRVQALDKELEKLSKQLDDALANSPEKAQALADKINTRTAERDFLAREFAQTEFDFDAAPADTPAAAQPAPAPTAAKVDEDPAIAALRSSQYAGDMFRKNGAWKHGRDKAWKAYNEFSDTEIDGALTELAPEPNAAWRIAMLEAIQAQRDAEKIAAWGATQGAQNGTAEVDAAGNQGQGADPAGSAGLAPSGGAGAGGAGVPAGAATRRGGTSASVGGAAPQQPTDLTTQGARNGSQTQPVQEGPGGQVAAQGQDAPREGAGQGQPVRQAKGPTLQESTVKAMGAVKFAPVQQRVFDHLSAMVADGRTDEVLDANNDPQYTIIGKALGLKRGSAKAAIDGVMRKLAEERGVTVAEIKSALRAGARQSRVTEEADETRLGESPDVQPSVIDERDLFGDDTSFGTVESVGGSQSETDEDPEATALAANRADPVAEKRAAEARASREAAIDTMLAQPWAAEAIEEWNDQRADDMPPAQELGREAAFDWMVSYGELKHGLITLDELTARQREVESDIRADPERARVGAGSLGSNQGPARIGDRPQGSSAADAAAAPAGESQQGIPRSPIEARVADLKARAGEKQARSIDKRIARYASGDMDLDRLTTELDTIEQQINDGVLYSEGTAQQGTTTDAIYAALSEIGGANVRRKVVVVQDPDVLVDNGVLESSMKDKAQGFVKDGRAYFIASHIPAGSERAVVLHEIGAHLGIEKLLTKAQYRQLVRKIAEWSDQENTLEGKLARRALARMDRANTPAEHAQPELIAYFIEEAVLAGVNPTATKYNTPIARWFRTLWAAFKTAIRRLGMVNADKLDAQDVVNLAYGAARLELNGTYHGTAADFRQFNHEFMGTGEGAQAFGWGTYLAQRFGIAKGYWEADVQRKSGSATMHVRDSATLSAALQSDPKLVIGGTDVSVTVPPDAEVSGSGRRVRMLVLRHEPDGSRKPQRLLVNTLYHADGSPLVYAEDLSTIVSELAAKAGQGGNIHAVDTNIEEDEMLDWGAPLSEQSQKVQDALSDAGLGYGDNDALVSGSSMYEDLTDKLGSDKAASEYLDSIGVKGIKFKDSKSRNRSLKDIRQEFLAELPEDAGFDEVAALIGSGTFSPGNEAVLRALIADDWLGFDYPAQAIGAALSAQIADYDASPALLSAIADLKARVASTITNNIVVFNDKNIFRVGSKRGGPDKEMRFSIASQVDDIIEANPKLKVVNTRLGAAVKAGLRNVFSGLAFTSDVVRAATKAGLAAAKDFELALRAKENRAREIQIELETVLSRYADLPKAMHRPVNALIYDMTFAGKWGFVPDWRSDVAETDLDADMVKRFKELPSAEARKVVVDVFRHGDSIFRRKRELLRNTVTSEYKTLIANAKDDAERKKLTRERDAELNRAGKLLTEIKGPYAPLRRFGEYAVVAKSQRLRDLQASGGQTDELMRDAKHYVVEFAHSAADAEVRRQELAAEGFGEEGVWAGLKEEAGGQMQELPFVAVQRLRELLKDSGEVGTKSRRVLDKMLVDLYISTLHETNARHAEQRRRSRAGASKEMMRAFATQGRADSYLVSSLEHSADIIEQMTKIREQAKATGGDTMLRTKLRNELMQRHMMGLDYHETPFQDKALAINSLWMLLTSPAYYVQNATQVLMMTQPVMAGRFGQAKSTSALIQAGRETLNTLTKNFSWNEAANLDNFKGLDREKLLLTELQKRGTLDFGISAELGYWENTGDVSKVFSKVMRNISMGTRKLEVMNRMTTALAGYRLAYENSDKSGDARHNEALEYADRLIVETHGDYSTQNAPRYLRMLPKIMTQFRKFQLIQLSLFANHIHGAFRGASAPEKAVARRALGYLALNHGLFAGALGLPAAALVQAVVSGLAGDDDDPYDTEVELRRAVGNKTAADLLLYGAPAAFGLNMSQRIGAGQMVDPLPFVKYEASRGGYEKLVTAATGPFIGGLIPQMADAMDRIRKGEVLQGTAQLLPRGFRDAMRGFDAANSGIKLRNGQQALTPEEISFYDALMMGIGMPTMKTTSRQDIQRKSTEYEQFYSARTTALKRKYTEAYADGDGQVMQEARQEWMDLQQARRKNGFKPQPLSTLLKAPSERRKAERKLEGGVRTTEQGREFVRGLM